MTRRIIAIPTAMVLIALSAHASLFAQQSPTAQSPSAPPTQAPHQLAPNPLITELLRAAPDGEEIVRFSGYVGPSTPETVRLYENLSLSRYLEIPRSAILHSEEGDSKTSPVKIFVRSSAIITSVNRSTASSLSTRGRKPVASSFKLGLQRGLPDQCITLCLECPWLILSCVACDACILQHEGL
jgi:hypothetical protein